MGNRSRKAGKHIVLKSKYLKQDIKTFKKHLKLNIDQPDQKFQKPVIKKYRRTPLEVTMARVRRLTLGQLISLKCEINDMLAKCDPLAVSTLELAVQMHRDMLVDTSTGCKMKGFSETIGG